MKLIISCILLCGISQANRLLQAADLVACTMDVRICPDGKTAVSRQAPNCEFAPCPCPFDNCKSYFDGCNKCYCGKDGKNICNKKWCDEHTIENPFCAVCHDGYILDNGKCRKPIVGDPCGKPGIDCPAMRCLSGYCGEDKCYGCCQKCTYEENAKGDLYCSGMIPKERVCPIIEAPVQKRCGGNGLVDCDNGYKCVANPNCPKGMTDCPGICVKQMAANIIIPPLIPVQRICGGFENCATYYDGCNNCQCGENGLDACTEIACPPELKSEAKCVRCKDGYVLNKANECVLERDTIIMKKKPSCGGIAYCQSFKKDSCNACGCSDPINDPNNAICTLQDCPALSEPVCTKCIDEYTLNDMSKECEKDIKIIEPPKEEEKCCKVSERPDFCFEGIACCPNGDWSCSIGDGKTYACGRRKMLVKGIHKFGEICENEMHNKVSCKTNNGNNGMDVCERDNGFECRPDPACFNKKGISSNLNLNCPNKVCLNVDGRCMFDGNCAKSHQCVLINDKNGFCIKYQKKKN